MRKLAVLVASLATLILAPAANASIPSVMGGDVQCATVTSEGNIGSGDVVTGTVGQRWCGSLPAAATTVLDGPLPTVRSTVKTFDGVPLDVNVAFPPDPAPASDTKWPVVGMYHGYGGSKMNFRDMQRWLNKGYAVYSVTNRGGGESCKSQGSLDADPAGCANGYVHLMDPRFEVRDTQLFLGRLVDDGVIDPNRIAAWGGSYGGSESMQLAVLKDRVMMPDGSLVPWKSPNGTPMSLAVATPSVPWTDLIQSLAPNGDTFDYLEDGSFTGVGGVMKESYVNGLYVSRRTAPTGSDPSADLGGWKALLDAGEPYTGAANQAMFDEITNYHSSYYVDHSQAPAPMMMASGFTDDLFPVDEVIRFWNRTRAQYPDAPMSIFAGSFGHARGQNQANVAGALKALEDTWVDHYLKETGPQPPSEITAYTQTCPNSSPGGGPYTATDWASLAPGEIVKKFGAKKTISPDGGDPAIGLLFNPLTAGTTGPSTDSTACSTASDAVEPGTVVYDTAPAGATASGNPTAGYTVMGSATVIAKISVPNGTESQIMARLLDLDGAGNKMLVARGSWRPKKSGFQVFQLHPGAWKVEEGHSLRLELLPRDAAQDPPAILNNYSRPSNDQQPVKIEKLELRIPTVEEPGALGGLVKAPAKKVLPARADAALAPGYEAIGSRTLKNYAAQYAVNPKLRGKGKAKGKTVKVKVTCASSADSCKKSKIVLKGKGRTIARGKGISVAPGKTRTVRLKLTGKGRKLMRDRKKVVRKDGRRKVRKISGVRKIRTKVVINGRKSGKLVVKRVGKVR